MSEYQATYDAMKDALDSAEFRQVFYEATLDAIKDQRIRELEKMVIAEQEASQAMTDRWAEANTRIRELNKALERAREQMIDQAERTEAAEAKLEKVLGGLEEIARSGDIEGFGEFIRGQASGWNQCRTQVQAIIKEVRDAN